MIRQARGGEAEESGPALDDLASKFGRPRPLVLGPDTATIGSNVTNSTTGNPHARYPFFFSQFAGNRSIDGGDPDDIDALTFHQYYFRGPGASASQFLKASSLDSLAEKIDLATEAASTRHRYLRGSFATVRLGAGAAGMQCLFLIVV